MTDDRQDRLQQLGDRVAALEACLATLPPGPRTGRRHRLLLAAALALPLLAAAGVGTAQQEVQVDLIRNVGGVTQVSGPFEVIDGGGRVLLSVGSGGSFNAAVKIHAREGSGGLVEANNGEGITVASLGTDPQGQGSLQLLEASGGVSLLADPDKLAIVGEAGKTVAAIQTAGKNGGQIAVWGDGKEAVAGLSGDAKGGALVVRDLAGVSVATLGASGDGKGELQILGKEQAVALLTVSEAGAGSLTLTDAGGGKGVVALGGASGSDSQSGGGGSVLVHDNGGQEAALLGTTPDGKGIVAILQQTRLVAQLTAAEAGTGVLALLNEDGASVLQASVNDSGAGELTLGTAAGNPGVTLWGAGSESAGALVTFNESGDIAATVGSEKGKGEIAVVQQDRSVATLAVNEAGAGELTLMNAQGEMGLQAWGNGQEAPGGALVVLNKSGDPVATVGSTVEGRGEITVADKNQDVAVLAANDAGAGHLHLTTSDGKIGLDANGQEVAGSGGGSLWIMNGTAHPVIALTTTGEDKGRIALVNDDKAIVEITNSDKDGGHLTLFRADGTRGVEADAFGLITTLNEQEQLVAGLGLSDEGTGRVAVYGEKGGLAQLGVSQSGAGMVWVKNTADTVVAGITGGVSSGGAILVTNAAGQTVSEMSVTGDGRGQMAVWAPGSSTPSALLTRSVEGTGGLVQVYNSSVSVASLTAGTGGGGILQLTDASGDPRVEAGTTTDGVGTVQVGPAFRCVGSGMGLKIPDCIRGMR